MSKDDEVKPVWRRLWFSIMVAAALIVAASHFGEAGTSRPLRYYTDSGNTALTYYTNGSGNGNNSHWGINTDNPQCELDINGTICINRTGYYYNGVNLSANSAPLNAQYVTLANDGILTAERVLTAGKAITLIDTGSNGIIQVNVTANTCTAGNYSRFDGSGFVCSADNSSGGGGTPGGSDKSVQFNNAGVFGGDSTLVHDITSSINKYGLYVGNTSGGTNNWDLYAGANYSSFARQKSLGWFNAGSVFTNLNGTTAGRAAGSFVSGGKTDDQYGSFFLGGNNASTPMTTVHGSYSGAEYTGSSTIDNVVAHTFASGNNGPGDVTTTYGVEVLDGGNNEGGTVTNTYGISIAQMDSGDTANWNLWSGDASSGLDPVFLWGNITGVSNVFLDTGTVNVVDIVTIKQSDGSVPNSYGSIVSAYNNDATPAVGDSVQGYFAEGGYGGSGTLPAAVAANAFVGNYGVGNISNAYAFQSGIVNVQTGTITNVIHADIGTTYNTGGGTIINNYGLYVQPMTDGTNVNYAIYTNTGTNSFGDDINMRGSSSGIVNIQTQAAAGTYNFNLPTTAGTAGQVLTSQAGGAAAMTWTTPSTGVTSLTGTANQINPSASTGAITLTLPQNINTTSTPQFAREGIGAAAGSVHLLTIAGGTVVADTHTLEITETWNNSSITFSGIKQNIVNTASNSASKVIDLQVGGSNVFAVRVDGQITSGGGLVAGGSVLSASTSRLGFGSTRTQMAAPSDGVMTISNAALTDFTRLQLGGTTSSFPAIKRNSAAINFRLADDSADAAITSAGITSSGSLIMSGSTSVVRLKSYTVATLPAGTQGDTAYVTDALAPTFLVAAVGGGAVVAPVFYNGAAWVTY